MSTVDSIDIDDSLDGPDSRQVNVSVQVTLVDETPLEFSTEV